MLRRVALVATALAMVVAACGNDDDDDRSAPRSVASTTARNGTTVITTGTTQTTERTDTTASTTEPIPPVTPPASQPEACVVLAAAADLEPAALEEDDRPDGLPAPSTGCRAADGDVTLALFYGQDPLETLAVVRVQYPGGPVAGVGQDAYESGKTLYVDAGSRAFAVTSSGGRDELVALAQGVIANL